MVLSLRGVKAPAELSAVDSVATDVVAGRCVLVRASRIADLGSSSGHVRLSSWPEN